MGRMTDDEKRRRRHVRDAAKKTAKEKEQAGIFASLVRETTARDEFWRWRFNKAEAAERIDYICGPARKALDWLTLHDWKRRALATLALDQISEALYRAASVEPRS
jgi:hypothetical protein